MPRKNKILLRTGSTTPSASDFATSEPAWDSSAGKLFIKNAAGTMVQIGSGGSTSASDLTSGTLSDARLSDAARAATLMFLWANFR